MDVRIAVMVVVVKMKTIYVSYKKNPVVDSFILREIDRKYSRLTTKTA
jgi:hypothetical protein